MPIVKVNDAEMYHELRGSGPPLLFIAGAFSDVRHFAKVAELLGDEFTVVTYDRRGYSRSTGGGRPTDPATQANDAAGLLDALSLAPAAVYGNSSGAIIALDPVLRHPAAVQAAILHEPPLLSGLARPEEVQGAIGGVVERGMRAGGGGRGLLPVRGGRRELGVNRQRSSGSHQEECSDVLWIRDRQL